MLIIELGLLGMIFTPRRLRTKRPLILMIAGAMLMVTVAAGCGGGHGGAVSPSSTQALTAIAATNPGGGAVTFTGLPAATLGTVTKR